VSGMGSRAMHERVPSPTPDERYPTLHTRDPTPAWDDASRRRRRTATTDEREDHLIQ